MAVREGDGGAVRTARVRRGGWGCSRLGEALWPGLEYGLKLVSFHGAATHEYEFCRAVQPMSMSFVERCNP